MSKTITSGGVTFLDVTDNRKLDAYITSNLPIAQIFDQNSQTYNPDWNTTNLQLSADIYLDAKTVTTDSKTSITWYKKIGTQSKTQVGSGANLTINSNQLTGNVGIITYICEAIYDDNATNPPTAHAEIVFTRVDTGLNGSNGQDGTSVTILGSYDTLAELQTAHPTGNAGDAYIIGGNLYVWAVDDAEWENVGNIQGPAGTNGRDAKNIILTGDSQVFKVSKTNVITPSTIKVTAYAFNTTVINWTYSTNGGQTFLSTVPTGVSRNGNTVTITGSTITSNSITIKASDGEVEDVFTVYKAVDGLDGSKGDDGDSAPIAFLTNENVTFSANAQGQISSTTITSNIVAYNGTTKVTPTIGTITGAPTGMTITPSTITASNEIMLTITIANNSTLGSVSNNMGVISIPVTYPVSTVLSLTWSKVNAGTPGATGPAGSDAYTVMLTNESHIFAGDVSNALAGSTTTQIIAYKGAATQPVTITSVNGKAASTIDTDTGITGLKFKCSALSGTSPTITFTCTTAFANASGSIPIVLSVGGISFTKMFTYSISFKGSTGAQGQTGQQGPQGQQGVSASLVDITPSALYFKSTTGKDGIFTPEFIYLYPRFQTVTYSKWEYSTNGGTTWNIVNTGNNDLTISTFNSVANTLRIKNTSALYTDTVTSISFRCVSSNTSVYDTVSIAKIYDVVDLNIGGRNYILNSANLSVSGLGSSYGSRMEYKPLDVGQSYMNITSGTEVTISFDLEMTVGTANPTLTIYNSNRLGPKIIASKSLRFTAAVGDVIKQRCSVVTQITDRENPTLTTNTIEFYSTYETSNWFKISNLKLEIGNKATDWSPAPEDLKSTTFQLYAPKGYLITNDVPEITLETFAYDGSQPITDATFAWSSWNGEAWTAISSATSTSLTLNKSNVLKSGVYKCDMTYGDKVYTATATVEDKTDVYDSLIHVTSKYSPTNRLYWVLYSTVYSEEGEKDELLGPVSVTAPMSPTTGAYWYKIDETNYTVTLMKYSETAWAVSTDKQEFVYDWFMLNDTNNIVTLGERSKVKIVTADNFSRTCSVQCNVLDQELAALTHSNQVLNDPSDPIVSETEPSNPINGQLWIKTNASGSYMLLVWDASNSKWVVSEADTQKKVYVSKPTTYNDGDIWIVASEYEPDSYIDGVLQTEVIDGVTKAIKHLAGTMLIAQYGSETYKDSDWVSALNYKKEINKLKENLDAYNQFFTFDNTGMTMKAKNLNGQISEFSTKLTNNELGFYQGENKVAYINNNQLNISKAEITNGMVVGGDAPMIQIGNFVIMQESNGSLSIGLKS